MKRKTTIVRGVVAGLFVSLLTLAGCGARDLPDLLVPEEETAFAESVLTELRNGNVEYVFGLLKDELKVQVDEDQLTKVGETFHEGEPMSVEIIGSQIRVFNDVWTGNFTYEFEFESGWNIANVALVRTGDDYQVYGLNVLRTEASQAEINKFTLAEKSLIHYAVLTLAVLIPVFILVTLIVLVRTPIKRRKWLWFLFVMLGIGTLQLNWTTGAIVFQLLNIQLLGVSFMAFGASAPWIISVSLPFGAIVFWTRRAELIESASEVQADEGDGGQN